MLTRQRGNKGERKRVCESTRKINKGGRVERKCYEYQRENRVTPSVYLRRFELLVGFFQIVTSRHESTKKIRNRSIFWSLEFDRAKTEIPSVILSVSFIGNRWWSSFSKGESGQSLKCRQKR